MVFLRLNENTEKTQQNEYFKRTTASFLQREQNSIFKENAEEKNNKTYAKSQCDRFLSLYYGRPI